MEEEQEDGVKVLTISELLHRSRPLTGASYLARCRPIPPSSLPYPSDRHENPSGNPYPKILKSLNNPTVIIGTLTLPTHNTPSPSNPTSPCPKTSCFLFSDNSSTVCCDVLDFDIGMIGTKIRALAWNFIPFKSGGGSLEIISWRFSEACQFSSNLVSFPLISCSSADCKEDLKGGSYVRGALESVSPVSVVHCATGPNCTGAQNVSGFLAQILVCECKLCNEKVSMMALLDQTERQKNHSFTKPLTVYFCGLASSWHPAITKLLGKVVLLSGLKKKLVFIGDEQTQLMYVTTEKSLLHLPKVLERWFPASRTLIKGKGECGVYTGTVTGIYMQGMAVELDQIVFLLLTDQQLALPHSVRVGAILSIRNVHFVNPNFSWTKILVLGACFKTSIYLESFSPLETGCCIYLRSQSLLGKFIDSLVYSARLWVLLLVSSFRKKFAGVLPEKEILGSKHKEGLVQSYATSHLPSSVFQSRHGVFREYCKHDSCGCGKEPNYGQLKFVVPISNFISHCDALWMKMCLERETDYESANDYDKKSSLSREGVYSSMTFRRILHTADIGVTLLGWLKISPSTGRLQLIDATGTIDVLIPDLPSTWSINHIYEVSDYRLLVEGVTDQVNHLGILFNESLLCRSIFGSVSCIRVVKVIMYLLYNFRDTKLVDHPFNSLIRNKGNFAELQSGRFHMLLVTHIYPLKQEFQGEAVISNNSSMFAEAFLLPWDMYFLGNDGHTNPTNLSADLLKESSINYQECVSRKKCKIDQASSRDLSSKLRVGGHQSRLINSCSTATTSYEEQKCPDISSSPKIPCFITCRSNNNQFLVSSATLCGSRSRIKVSCGRKPMAHSLLLEFKPESFSKYKLLKIGGYYIIKHHKEDMLCAIEDIANIDCSKVIITSTTHLWSSSFSSDHVLPNANAFYLPRFFYTTNEIQKEFPFLRLNDEFPQLQSDVTVHLAANDLNYFKENLKVLNENVAKPFISLKEIANGSWCNEMTGSMQSPGDHNSDNQLPEGNLISLHGQVLAVHNLGCSSFAANSSHKDHIDVHREKIFQVAKSVYIHILVDSHSVRIIGASSKQSYPVGFGPGCSADFYRILILSGQNELIMTPSSFIEIKDIRGTADKQCEKYNYQSVPSGIGDVASLNTLPSVLISEIMQSVDCKPVQFHCRIVAVYNLLMEKNGKAVYSQPRIHTRSDMFRIPLAGFVLDDGSSSSCCWANNDTAVALLRLHEKISPEMAKSIREPKKIKEDGNCSTIIHHLEKIVKKHGGISVRNYGSMSDSSGQDLAFSVTSDTVFNSSDEEFLKCVILNACFSTGWTLVGSLMDSYAVGKLEKQLADIDMTMLPMQNIWIREVHCTNPLPEARRIMQELLI